MTVSFPSNPNNGDTYLYNGTVFVFDGVKWVSGGATAYASSAQGELAETAVQRGGDNMTGDLTLGTDKITLDASDGSASFAGNIAGSTVTTKRTDVTDANAASVIITDSTDKINSYITSGGTYMIGGGLAGSYPSDTPNIRLDGASGSAVFAGDITSGADPNVTGAPVGVIVKERGQIVASRTTTDPIWTGYQNGNDDYTSLIRADGDAVFMGNLGVGTTVPTIYGGRYRTIEVTGAGGDDGGVFSTASTDYSVKAYFYADANSNSGRIGTVTNHPFLFATNTLERMRLDTDGRLLLGTSSNLEDFIFQVDGNTGNLASFTRYQADGASIRIGSSRGTQVSKTALVVNDLGGVIDLDGYTGTEFSTLGRIAAACDGQAPASGNSPGRLVFSTTASGSSSPTERLRVGNDGRPYFYTSTGPLTVSNAAGSNTTNRIFQGTFGASAVGTGTTSFYVTTNGDVSNSNNAYGAISDITLKENIVPASNQWDNIKDIEIVNYNLKEETGHQTHKQLGVIAQQVEEVSPGLVKTNEEGLKSVNYSVLNIKAIKALQEAMARIEQLETQNSSLEARLSALEQA